MVLSSLRSHHLPHHLFSVELLILCKILFELYGIKGQIKALTYTHNNKHYTRKLQFLSVWLLVHGVGAWESLRWHHTDQLAILITATFSRWGALDSHVKFCSCEPRGVVHKIFLSVFKWHCLFQVSFCSGCFFVCFLPWDCSYSFFLPWQLLIILSKQCTVVSSLKPSLSLCSSFLV